MVALPRQPENLNPIAADNVYEGNQTFFNGLLRYAKDLSPQPDLAAALPTRSADGRRVTVKLRDRRPLPRRHAADGEGRRVHLQRDPRQGLGLAAGDACWTRCDEARAIDRSTVEFRLKRVDPAFYDKLQVGIVPAHLLEGQDLKTAAFNRTAGRHRPVRDQGVPAGRPDRDGRPTATTSAARRRSSASCRPRCRTRTRASRCSRRARSTPPGSCPSSPTACAATATTTCSRSATADARTLALPTRDPVLRDPAVRRALSFAVDREQLVSGALAGAGEPAYGPIMKGHWAYDPVAETRVRPGRGRAPPRRRGLAARRRRAAHRDGRTLGFTLMYPADRQRAQGHRARRRRPTWRRSACRSSSKG